MPRVSSTFIRKRGLVTRRWPFSASIFEWRHFGISTFHNLTFFVRVSSLTPPTTSRGNFHIFSPELIVLDSLNVRDDIETNSGVKIPVSRSDMSFQSERE